MTTACKSGLQKFAAEIAVEAYVYCYPLVLMDVTRRVITNVPPGIKDGFGPENKFLHMRAFPDANFREVVRPNFDTLYSCAWLDLSSEPMIISAPDTNGRYYLLPTLDMWTDVIAVPGARTSGTGAGHWAVVPPGWSGELPAGVDRIQATTPIVWIIGRTQTNSTPDYPAVHKVQDGYALTPLSQWGKPAAPPAHTPDPTVDMKTSPMSQTDRMPGKDFFTYAAELMMKHAPHSTDWSQLERMRAIGIVPGQPFDYASLTPDVQAAVDAAPAEAMKRMKEKVPTLARTANGWSMSSDTMGVYGNYYLKRACIALVGLGANEPADAIYPMALVDSEGHPFDGNNRYVLHFDAAGLPPVNAFWSLTMYDAEGFQSANELDRFAIGDRDPLVYNPDGSLDLYIQHENPGPGKVANWLPCPNVPLGMTMRLYWPKPEVLDGRWNPPAVQRIR